MSEHEAGRALDAKVAEIMGTLEWEWVIEGTSRSEVFATVEEAMAAKPALERHYLVGDLVLASSVPDYSTDLAAAMDVAVLCEREGRWFHLAYFSSLGEWRASLNREDASDNATADTPALAICRAALKAAEAPHA